MGRNTSPNKSEKRLFLTCGKTLETSPGLTKLHNKISEILDWLIFTRFFPEFPYGTL